VFSSLVVHGKLEACGYKGLLFYWAQVCRVWGEL